MDDVMRDKGLDRAIKLSSNENSMGPAPLAIAAIESAMQKVNRYPDATGTALRTKLAKKFDVKIENVIIGAGSEGIMSNILRTFLLGDDEIVAAADSFIGFRVLANATGRSIHWVPMENHRINLDGIAEKINDYTKIIYIANPDNPMGTYITKEELDKFYAHVPKRVLVILDEAYFEFAAHIEEYPDSMKYRYDNVITLRTFAERRVKINFPSISLMSLYERTSAPIPWLLIQRECFKSRIMRRNPSFSRLLTFSNSVSVSGGPIKFPEILRTATFM
jgi:histidinol-phosphate aminotransferase